MASDELCEACAAAAVRIVAVMVACLGVVNCERVDASFIRLLAIFYILLLSRSGLVYTAAASAAAAGGVDNSGLNVRENVRSIYALIECNQSFGIHARIVVDEAHHRGDSGTICSIKKKLAVAVLYFPGQAIEL